MGKNLVIRGADFSANAIYKFENVTDQIVIVQSTSGFSLVTSSLDSDRAGAKPRIDLSSYIANGYTKGVLECRVDGIIAGIIETGEGNPTSGAKHSVVCGTLSSWGSKGVYEFNLDINKPFVFVQINTTLAGVRLNANEYIGLTLYK